MQALEAKDRPRCRSGCRIVITVGLTTITETTSCCSNRSVTTRIAAAAWEIPSYSPYGTNVHPHLIHGSLHRRSLRGKFAPPQTLGSWIIFLQNEISTWHLLYTVIHNRLKISFFHYLSGMLKDWIHWNVPTSIACRLQSYSLRAYCQNTQS